MSAADGQLVIYGAWYFGAVIQEVAQALGWDVVGFVDPDPPSGVATLHSVPAGAVVFAAIGDNEIRSSVNKVLKEHGRILATLVHPSAVVSPSAQLGAGTYVAELAAVRSNASIGEGVILQAGSVVSHDCIVAAGASFGPNAAAASKTSVGEHTMVGVGASLAPGVTIGENCTVAAGAAVFKPVEANKTVVGNPARATASPEKKVKHSDWDANDVW